LECHEASKHHLLLDSINLGFLLREKLAAVLIKPSSWGSQLDGDLHHHHHTKQGFTLLLGEGTPTSFLAPLSGVS
jgi:hypothetical protein